MRLAFINLLQTLEFAQKNKIKIIKVIIIIIIIINIITLRITKIYTLKLNLIKLIYYLSAFKIYK